MQDYTSNNKIKENKYKILRMSLLLGSDDNKAETINNFEEAARDIDAMNDEIYLKDLEKKFYDTRTLEEEEKKLADLVDYIGGRVEQRISLLSDFANVTGYDLMNLPPIKYYDKLDDYKDRLKYIQEYLSNTKEINELNIKVDSMENKLKDAYISKATSEESNRRSEEILLNKFINTIKTEENLENIDENNIDEQLSYISVKTEESKKSLDIFEKSFNTLENSGISQEEEQEYKSYVDNAKEVYYENKEIEYLLKIYKELLSKEEEYSKIILKRDSINNTLYERIELRRKLNIKSNDILESIYDLLDRQYEDIKKQKNNIDNIEELSNQISRNKEQINELELDNQKVEILAILREYGIIDTYNDNISTIDTEEEDNNLSIEESIENNDNQIEESIEEPTEESIEEPTEESIEDINEFKAPEFNEKNDIFSIPLEIKKEEPTEEKNIEIEPEKDTKNEIIEENSEITEEDAKDNQIINIENPTNIDLEYVQAKANKVMKRVGEMLGIKTEDTKIVSVSNNEELKKEESPKDETIAQEENPLFNNSIEKIEESTPEKEEDNFWFPSDTPDALNELPDLEVTPSDNFFTNNNMEDLNFPDLKINFDNDDSEVK